MVKGKPIRGFSRYSTDGVRVYRNGRRCTPHTSGVYKLIPDGERVNTKDLKIKKALKGNPKPQASAQAD